MWAHARVVSVTTVPDPDFAQEVIADLYRYRHKRLSVAWLLLLLTGVFGGHRFYLGQPLWGLVYLLSVGGGLVLWIWDFKRLRRLVTQYNQIEDQCRQAGLPPQSLSWLPPIHALNLNDPPNWMERRGSRVVLLGGTFLLAMLGFAMGVVAGASGVLEPLIILIAFMAVTLVSARWAAMRNIPILGELSRWNHRLRLYYFTTDPGSVWALAARSIVGVFIAPWRKRSRVEVRLYLQIGVAFGLTFATFDLYQVYQSGFWKGVTQTLAEFAQTIVYTYVFVAPVGAILLTQQLLARKDRVVVMMCLVNLLCCWIGLMLVGAI